MRYADLLVETVSANLLARLTKIAQACDSVEQFIRKTDGEDVLYRGHTGDRTGDNAFMTDYVGHAAGYAGDDGKIDAFGFEPSDVMYYDDRRFDEMRNAYRGLSDQQLAAVYKASLTGEVFANAMMNSGLRTGRQVLAKVKRILRGDIPYAKLSGDPTANDLLIPLLQLYAREHGKNIIAFHGNDYADYGGQTEYVVGDISKLANLRVLYAQVRHPATKLHEEATTRFTLPPDIAQHVEFHGEFDPATRIAHIFNIGSSRKGYGTKAVAAFEQWAKAQGAWKVTGQSVPQSLPFWWKLGYRDRNYSIYKVL